jgi:hypothetical protein
MRFACLAVLAVVLASTSACTVYWGDDGDDIVCPQGDQEAGIADPGLVNPQTNQCEFFGTGGCGCGNPCPLAGAEADALAPVPSWGSCASSCIGLGEQQCITTPGCRTAYDWGCLFTDALCPLETPFLGCYPTDTTGPVNGTSCEGLDAWECSRHDDCLGAYGRDGTGFRQCAPEFVPECPPNADCG